MSPKRALSLAVMTVFVVAYSSAYAATSKIVYSLPDPDDLDEVAIDIWIADENGGNPTKILADEYTNIDPAFCGGKIVYSSNKDGDRDIWIMDKNGSNPTNLTGSGSAGDDTQPDCSSGTSVTVAFVSNKDLNLTEPKDELEIYKISIAGGTITRLTNNTKYNDAPSWCGSSKIAYLQHEGTDPIPAGDTIYVMKPDGTSVSRQTCSEWLHAAPDCSPDGSELAFTASDVLIATTPPDVQKANRDIYRIEICDEPTCCGGGGPVYCCFDPSQELRLTSDSAVDDAAS